MIIPAQRIVTDKIPAQNAATQTLRFRETADAVELVVEHKPLQFRCGKSCLRLQSDGTIELTNSQARITLDNAGEISINGKRIEQTAAEDLVLQGSKIWIG